MKITFDPIYTNGVDHCASSAKFRRIADHLLKNYEDVYIYWLIPSWSTEEEKEWLPKSNRIIYIPYDYDKYDRMKEYYRMTREMEHLLAFNGLLWDTDMLITNRVSVAPLFKYLMNKPNERKQEWSRKVLIIEDMPIMTFKKTVGLSHRYSQDLQTITGYLAADKVYISAFWEKKEVIEIAKQYITPTQIKRLQENIIETTPVLSCNLRLKSKAEIQKMLNNERKFCLGFTGRMNTTKIRIYDVFEIMDNHWVFSGTNSQIRCVMSTVSKGTGGVKYKDKKTLPSWLEVFRPKREQFWNLFHNEVDVFLFLSEEEDYSMTLMEPVMIGCPAIVNRAKWSISHLGPDYPFYINSVTEAYDCVKRFKENYPAMYKIFATWHRTHFTKLLNDRDTYYLPYMVDKAIDDWWAGFKEYSETTEVTKDNKIVKILLTYDKGGKLNIADALHQGVKDKKFNSLSDKSLNPATARTIPNGFGTNQNYYRLALKVHYGYKDISSKVGDLGK